MNNTQHRHMERAIAIARTSTCRQMHGVVISHGPRVLSVGVNTFRSSPLVCSDPPSQAAFHAEIMALRALRSDVKHERLTLYSARIGRSGEVALAKPCVRCQSVLDYEGITQVYWTEN